MTSRDNPLSIQALKDSFDPEWLDREIDSLAKKIVAADNARDTWKQKQLKLLEQRYGVRAPKNIPWPGCHNDSWPVTDPIIRRWTPAVVNLVLKAEPTAQFIARNPAFVEQARAAQEFYHWLFLSHMSDTPLEVLELVDYIAQHGVAYSRQGWNYRTELATRVLLVESLFPEGIEPAYNAYIQQMTQMAAQQGMEPQIVTIDQFVAQVLIEEYRLDPVLNADQIAQAALGILDGASSVRLIYRVCVDDKPAWEAVSPLQIIRPSQATKIQDDPFIVVVHRMNEDQIKGMVADGYFPQAEADKVMDRLGKPIGAESDANLGGRNYSLKSLYERVDGVRTAEFDEMPTAELWEIYAMADLSSGGVRERSITWYHNASKTRLTTFRYPYPFRDWPITEFQFEHRSKRVLGSRGIAEILTVFQKTANSIHNARLDAAQITLAPTFKVRTVGNHLSRNWNFRPGARIPVNDMNDFEPIIHDTRPLMELLREETMTKTLAEQLIGIFDPSLTQLQGTGRERRTATEVDAVVAQATEVHSMDAALFQLSMARVHRQLWDLWEDFGPEEIYANVLGEDQPKLVRKADISGDYDIIPAGSPLSTNRALMLQRARELLMYAMQDQSFVIDKYEAWSEFLGAHGYTYKKRMLRAPEEVQILQKAAQAIEEQNIKLESEL
ncbi:MAG: hypothetical protein JXA57_06605 [Armatimonadetes bacterium]|nr:hypothetical protein [Armatimonadota bacterium]